MKNAKANHSLIQVLTVERMPDGDECLTVDCEDYAALKSLPAAVEFGGRLFARTGWNSDRCVAYFKTSSWAIGSLAAIVR